jgi:hypothetical protein
LEHTKHGDEHACIHVSAFFSGLPRALRQRGRIAVLQAWFDESGKGQEPVYLLAGYVGDKSMWEDFADDWQAELDRSPVLPYLHASESQLFKGFNPKERLERLLRFVAIIERHKPLGVELVLKHSDYREFYRAISKHPLMTKAEKGTYRNPYMIGFQLVLSWMLMAQAKKRADTGIHEMIEVLFDEGIDRKQRLKTGFELFIASIKRRTPEFLDLLINKEAEFRDDKLLKPLQASDLLAWYLRRNCWEIVRKNAFNDPVWQALQDATEHQLFIYSADMLVNLLFRFHERSLRVMRTGQL